MLDLNQRPKDYEAAPSPLANPINKGYATHAEGNLEPLAFLQPVWERSLATQQLRSGNSALVSIK